MARSVRMIICLKTGFISTWTTPLCAASGNCFSGFNAFQRLVSNEFGFSSLSPPRRIAVYHDSYCIAVEWPRRDSMADFLVLSIPSWVIYYLMEPIFMSVYVIDIWHPLIKISPTMAYNKATYWSSDPCWINTFLTVTWTQLCLVPYTPIKHCPSRAK